MRKLQLIGFALMAVMFLASCGEENNNTIKTESPTIDEVEETIDDVKETIDDVENVSSNNSECDEFLEGYENFMDKYIAIIKKQKADPADMSIMTEYATIITEASKWAGKTPDCTDAEFVAKLSKIQMKIANAVSGM